MSRVRTSNVKLDNPTLNHLRDALQDADRWLQAHEISYLICGDVAEVLLWRPHLTCKIEILVGVNDQRILGILETALMHGFDRIPPAYARRQALGYRVWHAASLVELSIRAAESQHDLEALRRAVRIDLRGIGISVPTPEDHLVMQSRGRRLERAELDALLATYPKADRAYLQKYLLPNDERASKEERLLECSPCSYESLPLRTR